jgi:hypothetical protein
MSGHKGQSPKHLKKSHLRIYLTWLFPDLPLTPHLLGQESCLNLDLTKKIESNIIDKFQQLVLLYNFRLICIVLDTNIDLIRW